MTYAYEVRSERLDLANVFLFIRGLDGTRSEFAKAREARLGFLQRASFVKKHQLQKAKVCWAVIVCLQESRRKRP